MRKGSVSVAYQLCWLSCFEPQIRKMGLKNVLSLTCELVRNKTFRGIKLCYTEWMGFTFYWRNGKASYPD